MLLTGHDGRAQPRQRLCEAVQPIYPELASKYEASFYPFISSNVVTDKPLMLASGICIPMRRGRKAVAEALAPLVEQALPNAELAVSWPNR